MLGSKRHPREADAGHGAHHGGQCEVARAQRLVVGAVADGGLCVARFDPRIGMASAQLRHAPGNGREPFDDQALTGLQALEGYTVRPAYTISEERRLGRIKVGYCADLTAFAEDPATCPPEDLVDLPVRLTMVDGEAVYRG